MAVKILLESVGCRLNQAELEGMAARLRQQGHTLVASARECDVALLNTCAVTASAASDSRKKIRKIRSQRPGARIIVTGCWATLEPEQAMALGPGIQVVPNAHKDQATMGLPPGSNGSQPSGRTPIPGTRYRTRAFVKVQQGCDNSCTFCLTRLARGPSRSTHPRRVLDDVARAVDGGAKEVVLTGTQLSAWGRDLPGNQNLISLLDTLLADVGGARFRFSSLDPMDIPEGMVDRLLHPRLCRYLHLPIQSGSVATLSRMGRELDLSRLAALLAELRRRVSGIAISTDVIIGFPGETEDEFRESLQFLSSLDLAGVHMFTYSPRPGTKAASFPQQVPRVLAKERRSVLAKAMKLSAETFRGRFLGEVLQVLWISSSPIPGGGYRLKGVSDNNLRVAACFHHDLSNQLSMVRIIRNNSVELEGELL